MGNFDPNELVSTIVDQAHTIRRLAAENERLTAIALQKDARIDELEKAAERPPQEAPGDGE